MAQALPPVVVERTQDDVWANTCALTLRSMSPRPGGLRHSSTSQNRMSQFSQTPIGEGPSDLPDQVEFLRSPLPAADRQTDTDGYGMMRYQLVSLRFTLQVLFGKVQRNLSSVLRSLPGSRRSRKYFVIQSANLQAQASACAWRLASSE